MSARRHTLSMLLATIVVANVLSSAAPADASCGLSKMYTLAAGDAYPSRDYYEHVPQRLPPKGRRSLVVFLHGTSQTAANAACGVRWNALADNERFIVVYPEQSTDAARQGSPSRYWNWGQAAVFDHTQGEVRTIAEITKAVIKKWAIDPSHVYLTGISAGGIMASIMAASYPDLYRVLAVVAGCSYLCIDTAGDLTADRMKEGGRRPRVVPTIVFQGSTDYLVNAGMGETAVTGWVGANDLADNGQADGSVDRRPTSTTSYGFDSVGIDPDASDPDDSDVGRTCLHVDPPKGNNPCPGHTLGWSSYPYTVRLYNFAGSKRTAVESWLIHGISHNYPGGDPRAAEATYVDPIGPNITAEAWRFFKAQSAVNRP